MPFPREVRKNFCREIGYECQISNEKLNGNAELHSATRLHLVRTLMDGVGITAHKVFDGVLLSRKVHQKLHDIANNREKLVNPDASYASSETVHEITWESLNLANLDLAQKLWKAHKSSGLDGRKAEFELRRIRGMIDKRYSIPPPGEDYPDNVMASYKDGTKYYYETPEEYLQEISS